MTWLEENAKEVQRQLRIFLTLTNHWYDLKTHMLFVLNTKAKIIFVSTGDCPSLTHLHTLFSILALTIGSF